MDPKYSAFVATEANVSYAAPDPDRNISLKAAQAFLSNPKVQGLALGTAILVANEQPFFGLLLKPMGPTQLVDPSGPEGLLYPSNTEVDSSGKLVAPTENDPLDLVVNVLVIPLPGSLLAEMQVIPAPPAIPIPLSYYAMYEGTSTLVVNIQALKVKLGL